MRVGVIAPEFPPEIGGMQTYAYEFAREMATRGHQLTVYTCAHAGGEVTLPGVDILPVLTLRRAEDRRIVLERSHDVWHVMNACYAWLALETGPVVVSVNGNDFLRPYLPLARPRLDRMPLLWRSNRWRPALEQSIGQWLINRSVRRALPRAAHIFAVSHYTEEVLLRMHPRCRGRTSAAMVGVSDDYLAAPLAHAPGDRPRLITVCRLSEHRKNVDAVLRALAMLKDRYAFSYTVVGDGSLRAGLESLAGELGVADRVRFTGFVDGAELRKALAESHLFILASSIHPASHEGFGIVYLEANACGVPVLAARLAGAVEAVKEGRSGFFVEDTTPSSIARALERFLVGEVRFDASACRAFASQFTWAKVVDHVLGYYPQGA